MVKRMKLRLIELFAGYGSQAMALKRINADFESWRVVEFDKFAIKSYNAVHGTDYEPMDIMQIHAADLGICDTDKYLYMMTYSFPCTDLSVAGKMAGMEKGSGTRSGLLWEVERLLKEIVESGGELPQILFMENVPQVHGKKNKKAFGEWAGFLNSIGYTNFMEDLNAVDYGIPQNRKRCFMFSFLDCDIIYQFPEPMPLETSAEGLLENGVDERYYINTGKARNIIEQLIKSGQVLTSKRQELCDGTIKNPGTRTIANTITAKDRVIGTRSGEGNCAIVKRLGNIYGFDGGNYAGNVYDVNGLSPTIRTYQGGNAMPLIVWQYRIRKLTPRECGRLMGVSDEDIDKMAAVNSNTQLYKQFGNSIVVDVMCAMFEQLELDKKGEGG